MLRREPEDSRCLLHVTLDASRAEPTSAWSTWQSEHIILFVIIVIFGFSLGVLSIEGVQLTRSGH